MDLLLLSLAGIAGALYARWLWRFLHTLGRKLDLLYHQCRRCRREVAATLAGRLEDGPGLAGGGEAPYFSTPGPRAPGSFGIREAGRG